MNACYRLHMCHEHRLNAWKSCQGVVFCANTDACHIVNEWLILRQISSCPWNNLLIGLVWIPPLVTIYVDGPIQLCTYLIEYLLGCLLCTPGFILLLRDTIDLPPLRMSWWCPHRRWLSCRDTISNCWHEWISCWSLAHCIPAWSLNRLIIGFWIVSSTILEIVQYQAEIDVQIHILSTSSASPGVGRMRKGRRSVGPLCHDSTWWPVTSARQLQEWPKEMWMDV